MKSYFHLILLPVLVFIIGCSGSSFKGNETIPDLKGTLPTSFSTNLPLMVESVAPDSSPRSGTGILGLFHANIDSANLSGEFLPLRNASLDDAVEMVDITNFLRLAPCSNCAKLMGIKLDPDGNVVAEIGIKHPFGVGDPYKPITGRNRADLHVFNVEGTVIFNDSIRNTSFPGLNETLGPEFLANADGYSPYLDFAIDEIYPTNATVHPYILHFDDYTQGNFNPSNPMGFQSVTDPPPSGNLVMAMGCDYDAKDYVFNTTSGESFEFIFAVGCTYAISSANKSQRFNPEYQVPQHNKKAASEVMVGISNYLSPGNTSSSAELLIKVLDINHGVAVGDALDQMRADSSVSKIFVEVPGVTSGAVGGNATPTGGDGRDPSNPLSFSMTIHNDLAAGEGTYIGLVKVLDSYPTGQNESPLLNVMDGIKRVDPIANPLTGLYTLPEFATYLAFKIDVAINNLPPVASFTTIPVGSPDLLISQYRTVDFTSTSTDPDDPLTPAGQIVKYEWDFEWDGNPSSFNDDTSGAGTGSESHQYVSIATVRAGLRVTDAGIPPLSSDIYSIQIEVTEVSCGVEVHEYVGTYTLTGVAFASSVFMGDIAFFTTGPNAGKVVGQYGNGYFGVYDPGAANQPMTPFNSTCPYATNYYQEIETCPMTGRLFVAITYHAALWDSSGNSLGTWTDGTSPINAVEIDDNGDLWAMMRTGTQLSLNHYLYSPTAPYYQLPAAHTTDLTAKYPPASNWGCVDLVMDYSTRKMFVFCARFGTGEYKITTFDVSSGNAVELAERNNVFTKNINIMIGGDPYPYYIRRADIEIDHSIPEYCRILLAANTDYPGSIHFELARLDDELNTIDFSDNYQVPGGTITQMPQAITIAPTGTHPVIATPENPSQFLYFESSDW